MLLQDVLHLATCHSKAGLLSGTQPKIVYFVLTVQSSNPEAIPVQQSQYI